MGSFTIGDRAIIIRKDSGVNASGKPFCGMTGIVTRVNGANVFLRPLHYKHEMHFLDNGGELKKIHKPAKRCSIDRRRIQEAVKKVLYARKSSKKEKTKRGSALN
jgi:hypothetical protein